MDTLKISKELTATGLKQETSEKLTEILRTREEQSLNILATKDDITAVKKEIDAVKKEIDAVRKEIDAVRKELMQEIDLLRKEMHDMEIRFDEKLDAMATNIKNEIKLDIQIMGTRLLITICSAMFVLLTLFKFFDKLVK